MSRDDINAERGNAAAVKGATGLPFVGLTTATDGAWSARFWEKTGPRQYERRWCEAVRVVGERLSVTYCDTLRPVPNFRPELTRTVSAWGDATQAQLARLRIGIVGAGSVGSIVAEALARMGISQLRLLDFDTVERHNRDRLLHAKDRDVLFRLAKVEMLANVLRDSATAANFVVEPLEWSVVEEEGFRAALDCDVLFSCVDRPWPRSALNLIANAHLIPVVDGGIHLQTKRGNRGLKGADWRAHVVTPTRQCLECLGQYDSGLVSAEREGYLDNPTYIAGLPENHPIKRNENVFAFSLSTASFEILQLLSLMVAPSGISNPGAQMYHFVPGILDAKHEPCDPNCFFSEVVGKGDNSGVVITGRHGVAEGHRRQRQEFQESWRYKLALIQDALSVFSRFGQRRP